MLTKRWETQYSLETDGFMLVKGVVNNLDEHKKRFWNWLSYYPRPTEEDKAEPAPLTETLFTSQQSCELPPQTRGIFKHYGIGQSAFLWNLRIEPALLEVFSELYGTRDLIASFDSCNLSQPVHNAEDWWHIDQGYAKQGFQCLQGAVCIAQANGAGTGFLRGSHKQHEAFFQEFPDAQQAGDWTKLTPEQRQWFVLHSSPTTVCPEPGDVVIWDSRTVHQGVPPLISDAEPGTYRLVAYITYAPRAWATDAMLRKRRDAVVNGRTTNHWPHWMRLNGKVPWIRDAGNRVLLKRFPAQPTCEITPPMRALI